MEIPPDYEFLVNKRRWRSSYSAPARILRQKKNGHGTFVQLGKMKAL